MAREFSLMVGVALRYTMVLVIPSTVHTVSYARPSSKRKGGGLVNIVQQVSVEFGRFKESLGSTLLYTVYG